MKIVRVEVLALEAPVEVPWRIATARLSKMCGVPVQLLARGSGPEPISRKERAMNLRRFSRSAGWILPFVLLVGLEPAIGQAPPTENKGVTIGKPTSIDLGSQIDGVQGRALRVRVITLEPGGVLGLHSHKDRPAIAYIIRGELTEHREDGSVRVYHAGESWPVATDVTHWEENKGSEPLVLIAADIVKQ